MSIAREITRIVNAKGDLKTVINNKGGGLTNETIDQYAKAVSELPSSLPSSDWSKPIEWPDIKDLVENDSQPGYTYKHIYLMADDDDYSNLSGGAAYKVSDGNTFYSANAQHIRPGQFRSLGPYQKGGGAASGLHDVTYYQKA